MSFQFFGGVWSATGYFSMWKGQGWGGTARGTPSFFFPLLISTHIHTLTNLDLCGAGKSYAASFCRPSTQTLPVEQTVDLFGSSLKEEVNLINTPTCYTLTDVGLEASHQSFLSVFLSIAAFHCKCAKNFVHILLLSKKHNFVFAAFPLYEKCNSNHHPPTTSCRFLWPCDSCDAENRFHRRFAK